jgi:hypothetical protein
MRYNVFLPRIRTKPTNAFSFCPSRVQVEGLTGKIREFIPLIAVTYSDLVASRTNTEINDVSGNFSLTLIDVLDTFVVLDDCPGFESAVRNVINQVSFDVNTKPQVFETTIRVLGGLLSGHIFASQSGGRFYLPWYHGELLDLAYDLGRRLLPAFITRTGIPYARVSILLLSLQKTKPNITRS